MDNPPVFENPPNSSSSSSSYFSNQFFNFDTSNYAPVDLMAPPPVPSIPATASSSSPPASVPASTNTAPGSATTAATATSADSDSLFDYAGAMASNNSGNFANTSLSSSGSYNNNNYSNGINSNMSPITVIPESIHINDEIFFNNNYQFSYSSNVASGTNYNTNNDEMISNISSTNSLNNYFQKNQNLSPAQLIQSHQQQQQQHQQQQSQQQQQQLQHQQSHQQHQLHQQQQHQSQNQYQNHHQQLQHQFHQQPILSSQGSVTSHLNGQASNTTNNINGNSRQKPGSSSSSFSSTSSNSMAHSAAETTPTISETSVFPSVTTPSIHSTNAAMFSSQVVTPQYSSTRQLRNNSTTIPVDQLTLLSLKSMSTPGSATTFPASNQSEVVPPSLSQSLEQSLQTVAGKKSPSPDYYYTSNTTEVIDENPEERTINPRQLFTSNKIPTSLSSPSLSTLFNSYTNSYNSYTNNPNNSQKAANSVLFSNIPKLPNQGASTTVNNVGGNFNGNGAIANNNIVNSNGANSTTNKNLQLDFKMNDECYNAITYWLNNTSSTNTGKDADSDLASFDLNALDDVAAKIMANPTGIIKGNYANFASAKNRSHSYTANASNNHRRRNSVQLTNASSTQIEPFPSNGGLSQQQVQQFQQLQQTQQALDSFASAAGQKKKRRKSSVGYNDNNGVSSGSLNNSLNNSTTSMNNLMTNSILKQSPTLESPNISPTTSVVQTQNNNTILEKVPEPEHRARRTSSTTKLDTHDASSSSSPEKRPSLSANTISITPNSNGAFSCSECDKQFKRSEHLKRHIRSVHSNIRPFHCKYCEKKFSRSDNLAQHLKTHYRVDSEGNTNIIYGNPNSHTRTGPTTSSISAGQGKKKA
ncbi:uncharacterized protein RJT20DRAFT_132553 [Scheffersomyces xylosifermentans]|uniref:uncharacterized protein n=1 Tax=Scheffersomyces xylosifermentans TaxID=1304137 RepID=UPI00315C4CC5